MNSKFLVTASVIAILSVAAYPSAQAQVIIERGDSSYHPRQVEFALSNFPEMVPVEGLPIYVAPDVPANYFYFNEWFWIFLDGNWYTSQLYNGPWQWVDPNVVPMELLQIPIQYYYSPPQYFESWRVDEPPHWVELFGDVWFSHHREWRHHEREWHERPPPPHFEPSHDLTHGHDRDSDRSPHERADQQAVYLEHSNYSSEHPSQREDGHSDKTNPRSASEPPKTWSNPAPHDDRGQSSPPVQSTPRAEWVSPERRVPIDRSNSSGAPPATNNVAKPPPVLTPAPTPAAPTKSPTTNQNSTPEKKHHPEDHDK